MKIEHPNQLQTITLTSEAPCIGVKLIFEGTLDGRAEIQIPEHKERLLLPEDFDKRVRINGSPSPYTLKYVPDGAPTGEVKLKYWFIYEESD